MSRSMRKGPWVDPNILKKLARNKSTDNVTIKTWARDSEISPEMVGYLFAIHNGRTFTEIRISEEMVGHRLGEFSPTRKFVRHGGKMQKELEAGVAPGAAKPAPAAKK